MMMAFLVEIWLYTVPNKGRRHYFDRIAIVQKMEDILAWSWMYVYKSGMWYIL